MSVRLGGGGSGMKLEEGVVCMGRGVGEGVYVITSWCDFAG